MLTYTFSFREKMLLVFLSIVLIAVAWYNLVYLGIQSEITETDNAIAAVQDQIVVNSAKVTQLDSMKRSIAQYQADGVKPNPTPDYDNIQPLTSKLHTVLSAASEYNITFEDVDTSSGALAKRGLLLSYGTDTYETARAIILSLVNDTYPCSIDKLSINDNTSKRSSSSRAVASNGSSSDAFSVSAHLTFYEAITSAVLSSGKSDKGVDNSSAISAGKSLGMVSTESGAGTKLLTNGGVSSK